MARVAAGAVALLVLLAGCSQGGGVAPLTDVTRQPVVSVPAGDPPAELQVTDVVAGSGPAAAPGSTVTVRYVGVAWSTHRAFTSSWENDEPITFVLGAGRVIAGWDQGIVGMRVGGRRQLVVPPSLGYGDAAFGDIRAGETLLYVIDLVALT